jgi:hypothetical protein
MRIGISILSHQGHSVWENGLVQNVVFLAQSLRQLPFVDEMVLIDAGDGTPLPEEFLQLTPGCTVLRQEQVDHLDLIIEMAGGLDVAWLARQRERGAKVVWYVAGQPYVGLVEPQIFKKPGFFTQVDRCDAIWVLPKDASFAPLLRTLHRRPVKVAPYLWTPQFLEHRRAVVAQQGIQFGWQAAPRSDAWRVGMLEPNISVVKSSAIPMLACDAAYRQRPQAIQHMLVYCSLHLAEHRTMLHLANSLDLVKQHRATFLGRHDVVTVLACQLDAVVSHQWCNDQNYLYLDVLYGGYPLIHNSPWLADAGYYYPEFDIHAAAQALLRAHETHAANLPSYTAQANRVIKGLNPLNPENVLAHTRLVLELFGDRLPAREEIAA